MPFIGTIANTLAVVVGSLAGMALKRGVSQGMERALMQAMGLCVMFIGIMGTVAQMLTASVDEGGAVAFDTQGTLLLIASLVLGTLVGQAIDIEARMEDLGDWLRERFARGGAEQGAARFTEGFVTSSLIICVGAMAVVGGVQDGMGQPQTLFAKSILDFVIVLILASTMGAGVAFSALPILVYQGLFAAVGLVAGDVMTPGMASGLSMVGNVLIFGVGVNLMLSTMPVDAKVKVGNMLPALLVPIIYEVARMALSAY